MAKNLKLRAARAAMDLTQGRLVEKVSIARRTVSTIEKGDYNPSTDLCITVCRVLGKTLNNLFWEE